MVLSSAERDDLVQRVARKLTRAVARPEVIGDAVDRTLGALAARAARSGASSASAGPADVSRATPGGGETDEGVAVLAAAGIPDLASRVRCALDGEGVAIGALAAATEGRHTVVTLRVRSASAGQVRVAAEALGARFSWRGDVR
ncbi:MAG TPA: hypothetical protein VFV33_24095 [Gemmatimonadaceae bacterium]|nr:hypothetical protein [Gemmatimonadaceae bacterium]